MGFRMIFCDHRIFSQSELSQRNPIHNTGKQKKKAWHCSERSSGRHPGAGRCEKQLAQGPTVRGSRADMSPLVFRGPVQGCPIGSPATGRSEFIQTNSRVVLIAKRLIARPL